MKIVVGRLTKKQEARSQSHLTTRSIILEMKRGWGQDGNLRVGLCL